MKVALKILFSGVFLGAILLAGCEEKILNNAGSEQVRVQLSFRLTSPSLRSLVSTYQLTISADDMDTIVAQLVWADGFVVGVVENIPAGPGRTFTLECFDENLNLIYRGVTIAEVVAGQTVNVEIDLLPFVPLMRISPPFARLGAPQSADGIVDLTIKIYNTPDITSLEFVIQYDPGVLVPISIARHSGLSDSIVFSSETDKSTGEIFSSLFSPSGGVLIDSSGQQDLAVIRFQQRLTQDLPDSTLIEIISVRAFTDVETEFTGIFTDLAVIELETDTTLPPAPLMPVGFIGLEHDSTGEIAFTIFHLVWAPADGEQSIIGYHVYKRINGGPFNRVTDSPINTTLEDPEILAYNELGIDTTSTDFLQYYVTSVSSTNIESLPSDTVSFVPEKLWNPDRDKGALVSPQDCSFTATVPGFTWEADPNAVSYIVILVLENQEANDGQVIWIYRQNETTLTLGQIDGFTLFPLSQFPLTPNTLYRIEVEFVDTGNALAGFIESRFWPVGPEGFSGITETDDDGVKTGAIDTQDWCEESINGQILSPAFPNPTFSNAQIQFFVPFEDQVEILIYDDVGAPPIANLGGAERSQAGVSSVTWDLTDNTGSRVSKGIYRCVLVTDFFCCYGDIEVIDTPIVPNNPPVIDPVPPQSVNEGDTLQLTVFASDPDFDKVSFSVPAPPPFVFAETGFGGQVGLLITPDFTHAGVYSFDLIASDGSLTDTETVILTVIDVNRAPVVNPPSSPQSVDEGFFLQFNVFSSDPDGDTLLLSALNLPGGATFDLFEDQGIDQGMFGWTPDLEQADIYSVGFVAFDGELADTEFVSITVNNVNRAPVIIPINSQFVTELKRLSFIVSGSDPDDDFLTFSVENNPLNSSLTVDNEDVYFFQFDPDTTQAGIYNVTFIVSDGFLADSEIVTITVTDTVLTGDTGAPDTVSVESAFVNAGDHFPLAVRLFNDEPLSMASLGFSFVTSLFLDSISYTGSRINSVVGSFELTFIDNESGFALTGFDIFEGGLFPAGDGLLATLWFTVDPTEPDRVTSIDSSVVFPKGPVFFELFDSQDNPFTPEFIPGIVTITGNTAPSINFIPGTQVDEGATMSFLVSATDAESIPSLRTLGLPLNASFIDRGNGAGLFTFSPDFEQAGQYLVTFIASDGSLEDTSNAVINVTNVNQAPVINPIGPQSVLENSSLFFIIFAIDPDGDLVQYTVDTAAMPPNSFFLQNKVPGFVFDFRPDFFQAGVYPIRFFASDGSLTDTELVTITVQNLNRPPNITIDFVPAEICPFTLLQLNVTGSDPDFDPVNLRAENLPFNATFVDNGGGAGLFTSSLDIGLYIVKFIASDESLEDTLDVSILVVDCPLHGE
ncbi:MAG: hypothetical protein IH914_00360 [candidate division Zixibacteria bacterium]|nr:hypothetical protein [candidate division Zixibacteria bacterium]